MKKFLSLFLSIVMIISALPIMAGATETLTDVALNRPGFSRTYYGTNHPQNATDGNSNTRYMYTYAGWYYVDLGAQYTVDSIKLLFDTYNKGYSIYLTNTRPNAETLTMDVTATAEVGDTALDVGSDGYTTINVEDASKYRFVVLVHTKRIDLLEIQVMTADAIAESATYPVEVGAYKPVFSATINGTNYPYYANDRNINTEYMSSDISWASDGTDPALEQSFILDLGTAMPIEAVTYHPTNGNRGGGNFEWWRSKNVSIYLANDPNNLTDAVVINHDMFFGSNYLEVPESLKANSYRYIVIKGGATNNHRLLSIVDLGVYSNSSVARPSYSFNTNDRAHLISYDAEAKANYDDLSGNANTVALSYPSNITDGDLETEWAVYGGNANDVYIMLDLGKPQTIDYVTAMCGDKYSGNNVNRCAEIFVTNTNEFSTADAQIMHTENEDGMQPQKVMRLYTASDAMNGNKYRYVGVKIPDRRSLGGTWARTDLVMLDVYTKEANLDEVFTEITFEQDADVETKYSVNADKLLSVTGRSYDFIAAAYSSDGSLLDARINTVTPVKGVGAVLSSSIDFADSEYLADIAYVKTMLWDTDDSYRPIVASQAFPPESLISANMPSYNVQFGGASWKTAPETTNKQTYLTDGDTSDGTKVAGWGPATVTGFAFVDLGTAQKISKVTGYAQYERGSTGREVYLSNLKPNPTAEEAMAYTGKTDAAEAVEAYYKLFVQGTTDSGIKYVGNVKSQTDGKTGEFSFEADNIGSYRYVIVRYEHTNAAGDLYELRAYKKN